MGIILLFPLRRRRRRRKDPNRLTVRSCMKAAARRHAERAAVR